jgi:hypothetical protein
VAHHEDFESLAPPAAEWQPDTYPDDGPFSDNSSYFRNKGIVPPKAFRATVPFGAGNWLTAEAYTRTANALFAERFAVVPDPANPQNHVLRIASPLHTDATVVRPSQQLPAKYRVSLRVGFADFGDGVSPNGYKGGETAEPWLPGDATGQNGFYWLTILDAVPRPHNNVWIHHHRKVVLDSDNNVPPWMEMWDGTAFHLDGRRPLMMIALDGTQPEDDLTGPPFLSYSAGRWQPSGAIRAVDAYLPGEWYRAVIERDGDRFTLQASGRFKYGGEKTYTATIESAGIFHAGGTPDWFMFGDPHENFYLGSVLYDDVRLEVWQ